MDDDNNATTEVRIQFHLTNYILWVDEKTGIAHVKQEEEQLLTLRDPEE